MTNIAVVDRRHKGALLAGVERLSSQMRCLCKIRFQSVALIEMVESRYQSVVQDKRVETRYYSVLLIERVETQLVLLVDGDGTNENR